MTTARKWVLGGRVQGVGFRPFVYRMAQRYDVRGWVRNRAGEVEILALGEPDWLQHFAQALLNEAPPLSRPEILAELPAEPEAAEGFEIRASEALRSEHIHVPPDYFACDDCLSELGDPHDRRHRYPFINCTQCGPRYTLIARLPYDRANTSMAGFRLCPECAAEYRDPRDRRFHAEPTACPACGPQLEFRGASGQVRRADEALAATIRALRSGAIVAVKGVGGYHLVCDAASSDAVGRLRTRKRRPDKPLAVMFPPDARLAALRRAADPGRDHERLLRDPIRPIVLIPKRAACNLAPEISPGSGEIGAMLPYSPLHHLLMADFAAPLVMTSGNVSGEPVLTDNATAATRLAPVADAFLHHDRPILRPADDPVYRLIAGRPRPIRLGRGNAPLEMRLPRLLPEPVLALGGQLKNTIALGWGNRVVISPHLGDMDTHRGLQLLEQVAADLQSLYGISARRVVCDAHPDYATTRLASRLGLPLSLVYHHEAHASALAGELAIDQDRLVFTWDGAGFGRDGTIWGGEALLGGPGRWRRAATLRSFPLLGGERAAREPWRSALALCWEANQDWHACPEDTSLLRQAWTRRLNCPRTSSAGRLFDGAAALLGIVLRATYEGQAPGRLEAMCRERAEPMVLPLRRQGDGVWESDWAPLLELLQDTRRDPAHRAAVFHATLAEIVLAQARAVRAEHAVHRIGLTGGVFQNRVLCEMIVEGGERDGFTVDIPERLPCNDAGLSFGQIIEASAC